MGKPKFSRKKFETPKHPWQEQRIKDENELIKKYGLKNKKEIWKAETRLRRYRSQARELLAAITTGDKQSKKESDQLLLSLSRINILPPNSTLDDVLALDTENILSRRLQTIVYVKGFASTPNQARQLITHGHVSIDDKRVTIPGYIVTKNEEGNIGYTDDSPLNDSMHPARPKSDYDSIRKKKEVETKKDEKKEDKKEQKPKKTEEKPKEKKGSKEEKKPEEKKEEKDTKGKEEKPKDKKKPEEKKEIKEEKNKEPKKDEKKTEPVEKKEEQKDTKEKEEKPKEGGKK